MARIPSDGGSRQPGRSRRAVSRLRAGRPADQGCPHARPDSRPRNRQPAGTAAGHHRPPPRAPTLPSRPRFLLPGTVSASESPSGVRASQPARKRNQRPEMQKQGAVTGRGGRHQKHPGKNDKSPPTSTPSARWSHPPRGAAAPAGRPLTSRGSKLRLLCPKSSALPAGSWFSLMNIRTYHFDILVISLRARPIDSSLFVFLTRPAQDRVPNTKQKEPHIPGSRPARVQGASGPWDALPEHRPRRPARTPTAPGKSGPPTVTPGERVAPVAVGPVLAGEHRVAGEHVPGVALEGDGLAHAEVGVDHVPVLEGRGVRAVLQLVGWKTHAEASA